MHFVDEQDIARFEIGQDRGQVAGLGQARPGGGAEIYPQLAGDDLGEAGLAKARRAGGQHVVEGLGPGACGVDEYGKIGLGRFLADEFGECAGAQRLVGRLGRDRIAGDETGHRPSSCRAARISRASSTSSPRRAAARSTTRRAATSATPRPISAATASPAGVAVGAFPSRGGEPRVTPSATILSFSSTKMRAARRRPTPFALATRALSSRATAAASSWGGRTSSTASATLDPTPWIDCSKTNTRRSSRVRKP